MKTKPLYLILAALLAAGALWFAGSAWRAPRQPLPPDAANDPLRTEMEAGSETPTERPDPASRLVAPNPNRKFEKLTPEQRVRLARKGPIGG